MDFTPSVCPSLQCLSPSQEQRKQRGDPSRDETAMRDRLVARRHNHNQTVPHGYFVASGRGIVMD